MPIKIMNINVYEHWYMYVLVVVVINLTNGCYIAIHVC